jgi:hypothetical protein
MLQNALELRRVQVTLWLVFIFEVILFVGLSSVVDDALQSSWNQSLPCLNREFETNTSKHYAYTDTSKEFLGYGYVVYIWFIGL